MTFQSQVKGEWLRSHHGVEGEQKTENPLVEGEPSETNNDNDNDALGNENHDVNDNISIADELYEDEETFEDAYLEFDPSFSPMEKWNRDHPKEQFLVILISVF